jgi:hypothetical protein
MAQDWRQGACSITKTLGIHRIRVSILRWYYKYDSTRNLSSTSTPFFAFRVLTIQVGKQESFYCCSTSSTLEYCGNATG